MKKILILLICLALLVGCKDKTIVEENPGEEQGEVIDVKTDNGKWAVINETLTDSLNNKELIGAYSISAPDWENDRDEEHILFKKDDVALIMLYENKNYTDDNIANYEKTDSKKENIGSYNVDYEEGNVSYNKEQNHYVSYYINDDFTIKLIGISKEGNNELNDMIKTMIESILKVSNTK